MRGIVSPVRRASLSPAARDALLSDIEIPVVSEEDLYGGKLVAALDRQHPRDLFDVLQLFRHEGITPAIRRAFVVHLASHNRPIHEVLFPDLRDIEYEYANGFRGMAAEATSLSELLSPRERMIRDIQNGLDGSERRFLVSLAAAAPDWPLLGIEHLEQLPGTRWKLHNLMELKKHNAKKFAEQRDTVAGRLS